MISSGAVSIDRAFGDRLARRRLAITLVGVAVASGDLILATGPLRGGACLAGALLLATAGLRFLAGWRPIASPRAQALAVFVCGAASLLASPAWVAAIDPGTELVTVPWSHVVVSALVWPGIGAAIAGQGWVVEAARAALEARARASIPRTASSIEMPPRGFGLAIGGVTAGLLVGLGEAAFDAAAADAGGARTIGTALLFGGVAIALTALTARWIRQLLFLVREQARLDGVAAVDDYQRETGQAFEPLERRLEALAPLFAALERERDRQAFERVHTVDAVRALGPAAVPASEGAADLVDRIERTRRQVQTLHASGQGAADRENGFVQRVENAARGLVGVDHASRAISDRMASIAGAARESTTSLAELADTMRSVDGSASSIHELSSALVARAEQGRARFAETAAGMAGIRSATESAESIIRGLDARTREIGGILDVIDEVGDQTSLLALNAAIIAAQAGEHGRSFSVVAEEIRDLADRVLVSTKEIGGLIHSVQRESERAIGAIEAGSESVRKGEALAADVGRSLEDMTRASHAASARIEAVAGSVEKQSQILDRAIELSSRIEDSAREIEAADVDRTRNHARVAETMLGLRDAAAGLRTWIADQTAGLGRVDGELGSALDSACGLTNALEAQARAGQEVVRRTEAAGEPLRSIASIAAELAAAREAIRFETGAMRARAARTARTTKHSSETARSTGEDS